MDSSEATLARQRCEVHPDRAAVGLCERCGRTVCLECAIPFKGEIRCERCAALELGEPEPAPAERRLRLRVEHVNLGLLAIALTATVPAWHRSGTLTTPLAAWSFGLDGWAALGCIFLATATALGAMAVFRPGSTGAVAASCAFAGLSALAIAVTLLRAPEFFSATRAPLLALGCTAAACAALAFRLVRRPAI